MLPPVVSLLTCDQVILTSPEGSQIDPALHDHLPAIVTSTIVHCTRFALRVQSLCKHTLSLVRTIASFKHLKPILYLTIIDQSVVIL